MSNLAQVKENIDTFVNYREFTKDEEKTAHNIAQIIQSQGAISCTACKYCLEVCPRGINIPAIFGLYNMYKGSSAKNASFMFVYNYNALEESTRADKCIKCGLCNKNCPQGLDIPKLLAEVEKTVKEVEKKMS